MRTCVTFSSTRTASSRGARSRSASVRCWRRSRAAPRARELERREAAQRRPRIARAAALCGGRFGGGGGMCVGQRMRGRPAACPAAARGHWARQAPASVARTSARVRVSFLAISPLRHRPWLAAGIERALTGPLRAPLLPTPAHRVPHGFRCHRWRYVPTHASSPFRDGHMSPLLVRTALTPSLAPARAHRFRPLPGFAIMGFIGFFVKLIHVPINQLLLGQ